MVNWGWVEHAKEVPAFIPVYLTELTRCRSIEEAEPYLRRLSDVVILALSRPYQSDRMMGEYRKYLVHKSTADCAKQLWLQHPPSLALQQSIIDNALPYYYYFGPKEDVPSILKLFERGVLRPILNTIDGWRLRMLLELVCTHPVCGGQIVFRERTQGR
jgi:hypothetical protein